MLGSATRLVVFSGLPGTGKSALALAAINAPAGSLTSC
jgi:predicted kinase